MKNQNSLIVFLEHLRTNFSHFQKSSLKRKYNEIKIFKQFKKKNPRTRSNTHTYTIKTVDETYIVAGRF